ncbi:MAG: flagellar hook-basal body protein [bacterium]|nr:flagellar hook-basal body protein [bacterium]
MDRGIYAASSGGLMRNRQLDVVANNLANVSTVGFKAERLVSRQENFEDTLASRLASDNERAQYDQQRTPGIIDIRTQTDFSAGPIEYTGNPLNVAINEENTFFVVQTPEEEQYTRAGNFSLNNLSQIVSADGYPVLGDGGPIQVPQGKVSIDSGGNVSVDGQSVAKLRTVRIDNTEALKRVEGVRFRADDPLTQEAVEPMLVPQSVETANLNVVEAMVEMIDAQRGFEAYTKTVQTIDDMNDRAIRSARAAG